ncbi:universal stress protein [Streptomyces microflavus]|uniref:Universal stress protein n=2 Tax=Streptomyces microflavus TaxID=1919 RepID=A0A7J0CG95_STRMI|nr:MULTISPECIES: universal stress protein [Streptomyces]AGK75408.1 UspA domain containing protein [Streptomyces microflavus DSM 40593]MCX4650573.1 universal stress protein [Streptomyces microflavus]MDX2977964.1 universal stress protein [Streptomyces sp. NRRL_B-2249]WSS38468.1 universal stress protein [Streptomyces microflavus]WST12813.1 universal stress protein [Streptomyces microflavus]
MTSDLPDPAELGAVVVGVDASQQSRAAALWAAAEAELRGQPLGIIHAADIEGRSVLTSAETLQALWDTARDVLDETARAVREKFPDLIVTEELSRGDAVAGLRAAAGARGTIVVGSRGLGGFAALTLGSVGLGVAARTEVPVVVVRGETDRPATGVVTAAVHGTSDLDWLLIAAAEAQVRKASLRLLNVTNVLGYVGRFTTMLDSMGEITEEKVHETAAVADRVRKLYPDLTVTHDVETGTSVPGILVEATTLTDLLVMGARNRVLGSGAALGRVPHALLHHGHCPVQIVPPGYATAGDGG